MSQLTVEPISAPFPGSVAEGHPDGESCIATTSLVAGVVAIRADANLPQSGAAAPSGTGGIVLGIVKHEHQKAASRDRSAQSETDPLFLADDIAYIIKDGVVWVRVETAVTPLSPVHFRHTANGGNTVLGALRTGTDSNTADALPGAAFLGTAAAGELVRLQIKVP